MSRPLHPVDGTHPNGLAELGALLRRGSGGFWEHTRRFWGRSWMVAAHDVLTDDVHEISTHRRARDAAKAFQELRRGHLPEGHVAEIMQAVTGGWLLVDRAPRLHPGSSADENRLLEYVWGQDGHQIGVLEMNRPGEWWLLAAQDLTDEDLQPAFAAPPRFSDAVHHSRPAAIAAAIALHPQTRVPDDDTWLAEWSAQVRRFAGAEIASEFVLSTTFIGASGTVCSASGCPQEAHVRLTMTGSDIGSTSRLACFLHAGEAAAKHSGSGSPQLPPAR